MSTKVITNEQLQEVEQIIIKGYRNIDTRQLESHLYAMLLSNKYKPVKAVAEMLIGRMHHYLLTADEPVVHLDYKKGMGDSKFWAKQLINSLVLHEDEETQVMSKLLRRLLSDIAISEDHLSTNLSQLKWSA